MPTQVLPADSTGILRAAEILRQGGLVAFPTETVYGLGAHALDAGAVQRIFQAKQRPADDPLIVHVSATPLVAEVARLTPLAELLASRFWPGPLTLVLPKYPAVPAEVTAGLDTVAVRVPAHPIAQQLLQAAAIPIAAPSANLFSRPSPTRAEHVLEDLDGRIDMVLDGGPTSVGLESTIVDLSGVEPRLLRPGGVAAEDIEAALGRPLTAVERVRHGPQPAPGMLPTHYAPRTPLVLVLGPPAASRARLRAELEGAVGRGLRVGALVVDEDVPLVPPGVSVAAVGTEANTLGIASKLFAALRELDRCGCDVLYARLLTSDAVGLGRALADRLRRAANRTVQC